MFRQRPGFLHTLNLPMGLRWTRRRYCYRGHLEPAHPAGDRDGRIHNLVAREGRRRAESLPPAQTTLSETAASASTAAARCCGRHIQHRVLQAARKPGGDRAGNGTPGDAGDGGPAAWRSSISPAPAPAIPRQPLHRDTSNHRIRKVVLPAPSRAWRAPARLVSPAMKARTAPASALPAA